MSYSCSAAPKTPQNIFFTKKIFFEHFWRPVANLEELKLKIFVVVGLPRWEEAFCAKNEKNFEKIRIDVQKNWKKLWKNPYSYYSNTATANSGCSRRTVRGRLDGRLSNDLAVWCKICWQDITAFFSPGRYPFSPILHRIYLFVLLCMFNHFISIDWDAIALDLDYRLNCAIYAQMHHQIFLSLNIKMRMNFHRT